MPLPPFRVVQHGLYNSFLLTGDAFGVRSSMDLFFGMVTRGEKPLYQSAAGGRRKGGAASNIDIPFKKLVVNVLVDEDVFAGSEPELMLHMMSERGCVNPNDPGSEIYRLETTATIQQLGRGSQGFHVPEYARFAELVYFVCDKLGWEVDRLRGYRCRTSYPMPFGQYTITFELPEQPA